MSIFASTFRRVVTPGAMCCLGIRCISCRTPSIRKRTSRPSSCASKWTSLAPSSAASSMIELTMRTIGPSETPSSSSRSAIGAVSSRLAVVERLDRPRRRRGPGGRARRGSRRARRRRARAGSESRAAARRSPGRSAGRRARRGASRPRGGTAARPRGGARGAGICMLASDRHAGQPQVDERQAGGARRACARRPRSRQAPPRRAPRRMVLALARPRRARAPGGRAGRAPVASIRSATQLGRLVVNAGPAGPALRRCPRAPRPPSAGGGRAAHAACPPHPAPQKRLV